MKSSDSSENPPHALMLTSPYRMFFLMTAIFGTVSMALWMAGLHGVAPYGPDWHGHHWLLAMTWSGCGNAVLIRIERVLHPRRHRL